MPLDLKSFLGQRLKEKVTNVLNNPGVEPNFVEGFVIETNDRVGDDEILKLLSEYYNAKVFVRGEIYHWVSRPNEVTLLVIVTNLSKDTNGAQYLGGRKAGGAIGFRVTKHPEM